MKALPVFLAAVFVVSSLVAGVPVDAPTPGSVSASSSPDSSVTGVPEATAPTAGTRTTSGGASAATPSTDRPPLAQAPRSSTNGTLAGEAQSLNVLAVPADAVQRSTTDQHAVDLGPAVGFGANASELRMATLSAVARIEAAPSNDSRQRLLLGELNRIEQRVISLRTNERRAITAYSEGRLSSRSLLVHLARIDAEARSLEARRERLEQLALETSDFTIDSTRLASLERELDSFTGPVRSHIVDVLRGDVPASRFFVASGPQSVVLTVVQGDTWVREAYRGDLPRRTGETISPEDALNITSESYPGIWATKLSPTEVVGSGDSYLVRITHRRGELSAFVGASSGRVFKEFQRRPLDAMAGSDTATGVKDGLRLAVNRSYPGAPLKIALTEVETGDPVNANITVGPAGSESQLVGRTGADGTVWTLAPRGRFTVTAIRGNSVVVLTTTPTETPRVGAALDEGSNDTSS